LLSQKALSNERTVLLLPAALAAFLAAENAAGLVARDALPPQRSEEQLMLTLNALLQLQLEK
jgi:hypothetical protein